MRRNTILLLTAMALLLSLAAACGDDNDDDAGDVASEASPAAGETEVAAAEPEVVDFRVQLNWIPNIQHYGITYAWKEGLYEEANLNVSVEPGGQGVDPIQIVAAGGADISVSTPANLMTAVSQDIPLVAFAALYQKAPQALVCRGDSGISALTDVAGKTIGSKGPNDDTTLPLLFDRNGIDIEQVMIQPIGASSITELQAGIVDCQLAFAIDEPITLRLAGIEPVTFLLSDYGFPGQAYIYFTSRETYETKKDALVRWLEVTADAWQTYLDDPEGAAQWVIDSGVVDGLELEQQQTVAVVMTELLEPPDAPEGFRLLDIDLESWTAVAQQIFDQGRVGALPDINDTMTLEILELAYADGG